MHNFVVGKIRSHCTEWGIQLSHSTEERGEMMEAGAIKAAGPSLGYPFCLLLTLMYEAGALWLTSRQQFIPGMYHLIFNRTHSHAHKHTLRGMPAHTYSAFTPTHTHVILMQQDSNVISSNSGISSPYLCTQCYANCTIQVSTGQLETRAAAAHTTL